jgi:hypothetical protein
LISEKYFGVNLLPLFCKLEHFINYAKFVAPLLDVAYKMEQVNSCKKIFMRLTPRDDTATLFEVNLLNLFPKLELFIGILQNFQHL